MLRKIGIWVVIIAVVLFVAHHPDKAAADTKRGGSGISSVFDGFGTYLDNLTK